MKFSELMIVGREWYKPKAAGECSNESMSMYMGTG